MYQTLLKRIKNRLLNLLLKHIFNAVTEEDILVKKGDKMCIGNKVMTIQNVNSFKSSADMLLRDELFKQLLVDMKHKANEKMFKKAVSIEDLVFGKAMLYTIEVMELRLKSLKKLK